jgi:CRP/FNR family transcriptional regulator
MKQVPAIQAVNIVGPCRHKPAHERCASCFLDTSDYFAGLSVPAKIALQLVLSYKTFGRRETLYAEGGKAEHLYILISGEVKVYKSLSGGRQQIHKLVSIPGDLIGGEDLFLDTHHSTAESLDVVAVGCLAKEPLHRIMETHGEVRGTLLRSMARNLNSYVRHISNLGQKKAVERVASYLVFLFQTHRAHHQRSGLLMQSLTRVELADMLGIKRRALIYSLKTLESRKLISLARGGVVIHDMPALARIAEGC